MHWTPEREFWNRNLAESFLDKTLLLTVPLSTEENKWIPSNFSKNPGEMQRVKISDGPASRPDVAVLSVVSCYTVRNRFQCLVGHLDRVQILPLPSLLPFTTLALLCSRRDRLVSDLRTPSLVTCSEKSAPTPNSGQAAVSRVGGWCCRKTK